MKRIAHAGAALAAVLACAPAGAEPLVITPTTVVIAPDRHSAAVEIENAGDDAVDLQFRAYDWDQVGGQDRLAPTDALVVSPAIATVGPHAKQLFRVLQVGDAAAPNGTERAYRLRLNQLPRAGQAAVAILLEFSLPVFQAQVGAAPQLSWTMSPGSVTVTNKGTRRARLNQLALHETGGASVTLVGAASAYLLSGASRTFPLARPIATSAGARLVGTTDSGPLDLGATNAPPAALVTR